MNGSFIWSNRHDFDGLVDWHCTDAGIMVRLRGTVPTGSFHGGDRRFPIMSGVDATFPIESEDVPPSVRGAVLADLTHNAQPPAPDPIDELTGSNYIRVRTERAYARDQARFLAASM